MKLQCRCCLTTSSHIFYNIFDQYKSGTTCADIISLLAASHINPDDGLSQKICSHCNDELRRIYEFSLKVRDADETLRKELVNEKLQDDHEVQAGNMHLLDREYFAPEEDNGMHVCVVEEILEHENEQDVLMVEEIQEEEDIQIMEEISVSAKTKEVKAYNQKDNLLQNLAMVAASQENVDIDAQSSKNYDSMPEDENDEDYLIEYNQNDENASKAQKWKCGECKLVLRGDVSYEGHMNLHKQTRPHACHLCRAKYRCRAALKRHKDEKHSPTQNKDNNDKRLLCLLCQKKFCTEINFYLHQSVTHNQSDRCPFDCEEVNDNLKQHLEDSHITDIISAAEIAPSGNNTISGYQCFICSERLQKQDLFMEHVKSCQTMIEDRLFDYDEDERNHNVVEIVKLEQSEVSEKCRICQKVILKRNINKHMEMHKRKGQQECNAVEKTIPYLCAFCRTESLKMLKQILQAQKDFKLRIQKLEENQTYLSNGQVTTVTNQKTLFDKIAHTELITSIKAAEMLGQAKLLIEQKVVEERLETSEYSITEENCETKVEVMPTMTTMPTMPPLQHYANIRDADENLETKTAIQAIVAGDKCDLASMLPCRTLESVKEIEEKLESEIFVREMLTYTRNLKGELGTVCSVIRALFTDDVLVSYNWDGRWEKQSIVKLNICSKILREVFKEQSPIVFRTAVRTAVLRAHNRYKQRKYTEKKRPQRS